MNGIYSLYEGITIISVFHDINIENEIRKSKEKVSKVGSARTEKHGHRKVKESQQFAKVGKSSFKRLKPINEDDPNIVINDVINEVSTTMYKRRDLENEQKLMFNMSPFFLLVMRSMLI